MTGPILGVPRPRARLRKHVYTPDTTAGPPDPKLAAILERLRPVRGSLVAVLQEIQAVYGYLPTQQLRIAARELRLPLARVYGVATFYHQFRLTPPGQHIIRVCRGTACHVAHSGAILDALAEHLGIREDQTTADGRFTMQTVACVGACSLAPVLVCGSETHGRMTVARAIALVEQLRQSGELAPAVGEGGL